MHSSRPWAKELQRQGWPRPDVARIICLPVCPEDVHLLADTLSGLLSHTSVEAQILALPLRGARYAFEEILRETPNSERVITLDSNYCVHPWQALLRAIPQDYDDCDRLLILPGISVPPYWDARLALAAYAGDWNVAAVSPLTNALPILALSPMMDCVSLEAIDDIILSVSDRRNIDTPLLFSGCCYLRRSALRLVECDLGASEVTPDYDQWDRVSTILPARLKEVGWHTTYCDHVYVIDRGVGEPHRVWLNTVQHPDIDLIESVHPLTGMRYAIEEIFKRQLVLDCSLLKNRPRQLHIAHSWGGGLDRWVRQYCEHDNIRDNFVLRSIGNWGAFGQRIALYHSGELDEPIKFWELGYPIRSTAVAHLEYIDILYDIISEFGIEVLLISSLIGHSLDVLNTALPTVFIAHDYYPFCPALVIHYDGICCNCPPDQLARCFDQNPLNNFFRNVSAWEWLNLRRRFNKLLQSENLRLVVPSPSVIKHWHMLMPDFATRGFHVIAHGLDYKPTPLPSLAACGKLCVVVLGNLSPQKGLGLLTDIWQEIQYCADLYLVGCGKEGEAFRDYPGIHIITNYRHDELRNILAEISPELGLLLSICPETFSYALSELWALGIPVLATRVGSFQDRILPGVNGWLCEPRVDDIVVNLERLAANRAEIYSMRSTLANYEHRRPEEMIADYHALTPVPEIAFSRYLLPQRITRQNTNWTARNLYVADEAPYFGVLREFLEFTRQRCLHTPRLGKWQSKLLANFINTLLRWFTRG